MADDSLRTYLAELPLLRGLGDADLNILAGCAAAVSFDADTRIFRQGRSADHCYLIRDGMVAVQFHPAHGGSVTIQTLASGEVLGWSWLFPPYRWHFDARALEATNAIALDGKCLRERCEKDPALGYGLMKRLSRVMHERMQAARLQLMGMYGPDGLGVRRSAALPDD